MVSEDIEADSSTDIGRDGHLNPRLVPRHWWLFGRNRMALTKLACMLEYPRPWTTRGINTLNAWVGTLAQMLKIRTNQSFQSLAASTTSLLESRSFSRPSSPYSCWTNMAVSRCIRSVAKRRSSGVRNQAEPGPPGSRPQAAMATRHVSAPSMMNRYCQL